MKKTLTQTLALLADAYREFSSKRLFWISLILSAAVILVIGGVGISGNHVTFFGFNIPNPDPDAIVPDLPTLYHGMFVRLGVECWLSWGAMILAVASTGSMIPDFLAGGSVDLYLCRPMGRVRLYLTKYAAGLLFVALQAAVFAVAGYFTLGLRGGLWAGDIFICIPILVCIFCYLFCISALLGVVTRSAPASVMLTILFWVMLVVVYQVNQTLTERRLDEQRTIAMLGREVGPMETHGMAMRRADAAARLAQSRKNLADIESWRRWTVLAQRILPKAIPTNNIMVNRLAHSPPPMKGDPEDFSGARELGEVSLLGQDRDINRRVEALERRQSPLCIVGSSLAFEAVILALGAWCFKRRDY